MLLAARGLPTISAPEIFARVIWHVHRLALRTFWQMDVSPQEHYDMGIFRHGEFQPKEFFHHGHFGTRYFGT